MRDKVFSGTMMALCFALIPVTLWMASANTPEPLPYIAIDGDTIEVGPSKDRIRLTTIDAPEMPRHCRPGRVCVEGDPYAAQRKLQSLLTGTLYCPGWKRDVYKRKLSDCYVQYSDGTQDLPQAMLASGTVGVYRYERR